jgi:hypothetical protein
VKQKQIFGHSFADSKTRLFGIWDIFVAFPCFKQEQEQSPLRGPDFSLDSNNRILPGGRKVRATDS